MMKVSRDKATNSSLTVLILTALTIVVVVFIYLAIYKVSNPQSQTKLSCIENAPTNFLIGQVLMVGVPAKQIKSDSAIFKKYHLGGAILMTSPANPLSGSITDFKIKSGSFGVPVLIATDEEGGSIQRFKSLGNLPSPQEIVATKTTSQAEELINSHGQLLKKAGIDMVLGPLADVAPLGGSGPLGNRIFSNDPEVVFKYASAYINGWSEAGLIATIKHFPGMGSATGNTDFQPATTPSLAELEKRDFLPYKNLVSPSLAVMIGNQNVPGWFEGPASLNLKVNQHLRQTLGYKNNLVITDSLTALAVTGSIPISDAVVKALVAGNDIVLLVPNKDYPFNSLVTKTISKLKSSLSNGTISRQQLEKSVIRKLKTQGLSACSITFPS